MNSLLLVAHGSRREASNVEIRALTALLRHHPAHRFDHVSCAFLELAKPTIAMGIGDCVGRGATRITVFPYFLSAGRHVACDIPEAVKQAALDHPGVELNIAPHLGAAESIGDFILQQAGRVTTSPGDQRCERRPPVR